MTDEDRARAQALLKRVDQKLAKNQIAIRPPVTSRYSFKDFSEHGSAAEDRAVDATKYIPRPSRRKPNARNR